MENDGATALASVIILLVSLVITFYSWQAVAADYAKGIIDPSHFAWAMILSLWLLMPTPSRSK